MATAGIVISADFPELKAVGDAIRGLGDKEFTARSLEAALAKAIKPAEVRLRELTPVGPTGNLRAAVTSVAKAYTKNGNAVGLIGYRRTGKRGSESAAGGKVRVSSGGKGDRAYHQWLIEYGTRARVVSKFSNTPYQRKSPSAPFVRTRRGGGEESVRAHTRVRNGKSYSVKGFSRSRTATVQEVVQGSGESHTVKGQNAYIASSFKSLGPFQMIRQPGNRSRVQTSPPTPGAYFKKSANPIVIPPSPEGGVAGQPPIRTAFQQTQAQVAAILQQELRISLERALSTLTYRAEGTISGV
jgi:hypothetical protein